jgi:hypothetical protein
VRGSFYSLKAPISQASTSLALPRPRRVWLWASFSSDGPLIDPTGENSRVRDPGAGAPMPGRFAAYFRLWSLGGAGDRPFAAQTRRQTARPLCLLLEVNRPLLLHCGNACF